MLIYLAVAIDKNPAVKTLPTGDHLVESGKKLGSKLVIYMPSRAFGITEPDESGKALIAINKYALSRADAVVAFYSPGVESWGLPMELAYANEHNIPIYLVSNQSMEGAKYEQFPIYLKDLLPVEACFDIAEMDKMVNTMYSNFKGEKNGQASVEKN